MRKIFLKPLTILLAALVLALSASAAELVPVGEAVGLRLSGTGVTITDFSRIETADGTVSPAEMAGLLPGDVIISVDGRTILSAGELKESLASAGDSVVVGYRRGGEEKGARLSPVKNENGVFIGAWVRDSLSGIGTVTWYDPETGAFGALGHSVSEDGAGGSGEVYEAEITGVKVGKAGEPGQLEGAFASQEPIGTIERNTGVGVFGRLGVIPEGEPIPAAGRDEIRPGPAVMISSVTGEPKDYAVEVLRVYPASRDGRSMLIRVTDEELLEATGGIVQGMSGSPIIQNGKLIGAVTHVLIKDPTRGYGVSIEEMLAS